MSNLLFALLTFCIVALPVAAVGLFLTARQRCDAAARQSRSDDLDRLRNLDV